MDEKEKGEDKIIKKEEKHERTFVISKWQLFFGFLVIVFLAFILSSIINKPSSTDTSRIFYKTTTTICKSISYTEQEEYIDEECSSVPYTDRECEDKRLVYSKTDIKCYRGGLIGDWINSECTINNLDTEGGTFSVSIGVFIKGKAVGEVQQKYLYPQTSYTFKYPLKADADSCYCNEVDIPTKQVCRDVTKYREVCKSVRKYRPVTKYRQECG